jgi:addiction module HigA family antidote
MFKNGMRPVHPGEVLLKDYILPMGISVRALSLALQVPYSLLREIVDGKRGVSADIALRLDRYFGSGARGWLNLQAAYDLVGPVETVHLLRSRKNAERLLTALRRARTKSVEPTTLADLQRRMELDA